MSIFSRFKNLVRPNALDQEFDDELRFHLDQRITQNIERGMNREMAETAAHKQFGNVRQVKSEMREVRMLNRRVVAGVLVGIIAVSISVAAFIWHRARSQQMVLDTAQEGTAMKSQRPGAWVAGDFCCPEYLTDAVNRVRSRWVEQQQSTGKVLMRFTILRNGQIVDVQTERASSSFALDLASQRALILTGTLQPLPSAFPDDHLTVHLTFEYQRK